MKVVFIQDTHDEGDPEWEIWGEHVRGYVGLADRGRARPARGRDRIRKVRYDAFYGTPLDHFLRLWGVDTLVSVAPSPTSASTTRLRAPRCAGTRGIPRDAISAFDPFDLETSLSQASFLFSGSVTESDAIKTEQEGEPVYRSKIEEAAAEVQEHG